MSVSQPSDFIAAWAGKLQAASRPFDGRVSLPAWLAASARDQAEHVFLALAATPVEARDLHEGEEFVKASGLAFLDAWATTMAAFNSGSEPWAKTAADEAVKLYLGRLDELGPSLNAGGAA